MKLKKQNKRANIPILLLVIGVVAICILSIISFYFPNNKVEKDFSGIIVISEANLIIEQIKFYKSIGENPEELIDAFNKKIIKESNENIEFQIKIIDGSQTLIADYYKSNIFRFGDKKKIYSVEYKLLA